MTYKIYGMKRAAAFLEIDQRTLKAWIEKREVKPFAVDGKSQFWTREQLKELKRKHEGK